MSQPPCHFGERVSAISLFGSNDTYAGFFVGLCRPHSSAWVAGVARWFFWLDPSGTLSAGFPPPTVPLLDAGRLPLVPLLKYGSYEQLLDKQTGALLALPQRVTSFPLPLFFPLCLPIYMREKHSLTADLSRLVC